MMTITHHGPKTLKSKFLELQEMALCLVRKWWRPLVCLGIGGSVLVNGVIIPLLNRTVPDLIGLAALITAAAPFAWLRTHEKIRGATHSGPSEPPY